MNPMKPGWQTSEFWLSTSTQLIGMALASGIIPSDGSLMKILGLASALLATLGYTAARTAHKNNVVESLAAVSSLMPQATTNPH